MRISNEKVARTLLPAIVGAGCMVTLLSAMSAISEWQNAAPHVGDMVAFTTSRQLPSRSPTRLVAHRPDQSDCILDTGTLRRSGGSLVVERQVTEADGSFRVHWAGERTTTYASNCGDSADLILDVHDLNALASTAGGYSTIPMGLTAFDPGYGI